MNNEEKILEMLEKLNQAVEKQGAVLEKHGEMLEKLQLDVSGMKIRMDVEVKSQFNLLAEGQQSVLELMTPKDRVEELEADVIVLKTAVKMLSQEVAELKKAQ